MTQSILDRSVTQRLLGHWANLRNRHFLMVDFCALAISPSLALWLRLDGQEALPKYYGALLCYTLVAMLVRVLIGVPFGMYNRYWKYASVDELVQITLAMSA